MIVFISNSGESLPIVYRMKREGADVAIYIHSRRYRHNYDGILPKLSISQLRAMCRKAELVIFDITRPNEKTREDIAMLKVFGIKRSAKTVFGEVADKLSRDVRVIGCSAYTEHLEMDRYEGSKLAHKIGIRLPEEHEFKSLKEGIRFLEKHKDKLWVFKPHDNQDLDLTYVEKYEGELIQKMKWEYPARLGKDSVDYMLQAVVKGIEISTEGWFDGQKFVHFNHTIEDKRMMNGNLGVQVGSQSNTVWIKTNMGGLLVDELKKLGSYLGGYVGPIDINAIVSEEDHKPYFLEFSPRFGWDALYCLLSLLEGSITDFFTNGFKADFKQGEFACSQRISIPPYPYSDDDLLKLYAKDVSIDGELVNFWMEDVYFNHGFRCAGSDGILGVVTATGKDPVNAMGRVYGRINKLKISSYLQYRTDGSRRAERAIKKLTKWGVEID